MTMPLLKLSKETDSRTECLNELGKREEWGTVFRGFLPCPTPS